MKQITLKIKDSKYQFFMELINSLDFIEIKSTNEDTKDEIVANLSQAFSDLERYKKGELKAISANDFLDEL